MVDLGFRLNLKWPLLVTVLALGGALLTACGGDDGFGVPTRGATTAPAPGGQTPERPAVPTVDCGPLLTLEEVDDALGWSIGDDRAGPIEIARGEVCRHRLADDQDVFVQIQPGEPGDFEPGASVIGVSGEPVPAVGDEARWFGGEGSEAGGDVGALSVRQDTSLGALHFRIFVGRPDLDSAAQLEIAKTVALAALPRFPGVEVGYVNNLLVKEEAEEWTRGEGLVATLSLFAGEVEAAQVLLNPELVDFSGTGVIRMAREYLEDGPDAEAKTEIARLLEHLILTREQLEAMAGIGPPTVARGLQAISFGTARRADDCQTYFGSPAPCMVETHISRELDEMFGEGKYVLFVPEEELQTGWTDEHVLWAKTAIKKSAIAYEALGEVLKVNMIFTPFGGPHTFADPLFDDGVCFINFNRPMQQEEESTFKQNIAAAMAHCATPFEEERCDIDVCGSSEFFWPRAFGSP